MKKSLQKIQPRNGYLLTLYRKDRELDRKDTSLLPPKRTIDYSKSSPHETTGVLFETKEDADRYAIRFIQTRKYLSVQVSMV